MYALYFYCNVNAGTESGNMWIAFFFSKLEGVSEWCTYIYEQFGLLLSKKS